MHEESEQERQEGQEGDARDGEGKRRSERCPHARIAKERRIVVEGDEGSSGERARIREAQDDRVDERP